MQALAGPDAGVLLKDPLVEEWTANEGVDPQERAVEIRRLTVRSPRGLCSFCNVPAFQAERYRSCWPRPQAQAGLHSACRPGGLRLMRSQSILVAMPALLHYPTA